MPRGGLLATGLLVAITVALIAAVAGGSASARLGVTLDEWSIAPERSVVPAGPLRLEIDNAGTIDHELLIVRTGLGPDRIPVGLHGPDVARAGEILLGRPHAHGAGQGEEGHIRPGAAASAQVTLEPGSYVLLCTIGTHYLNGQRAQLTVTG